jgi:4-nitrophenyl phosphatase
MNLKTLKTLLIDGDGVLWHGNQPAPGLNHFFDVINQHRIKWALVTNNATAPVDDYVAKFKGFGIEASRESIFTSAIATAAYLRQRLEAGRSIYVVGERGIKEALTEAGFVVHDGNDRPERAAVVVVGLDRQLTYRKLEIATWLIRDGAAFIATNPDRTIPTPYGLSPGAGSVVAAVSAATDQQPVFIGKPKPAIFEVALSYFETDADSTAMIGDRLDTDILGAKQLGLKTILTLGGVARREDLAVSKIQPDLVAEGINDLAEQFEKAFAS